MTKPPKPNNHSKKQPILPLLTYDVTTAPKGALYTNEPGQVTITVTNPTQRTIYLSEIQFTFSVGALPANLATDFLGVQALSNGIVPFHNKGSGIFLVEPDPAVPVPVGREGLEFIVGTIPVNAQPGTTNVVISEATVKADTPGTAINQGDSITAQASDDDTMRVAIKTVPIDKVDAPLTVDGPFADPVQVDFGQSALISWNATTGATIQLEYDDIYVDTIKGHSGLLLANGTYEIENLTRATTTVQLNATLNRDGQAQSLHPQVNISLNKPEILSFETGRVRGAPNQVTVTWATKSAAEVKIKVGTDPAVTVAASGTMQFDTSLFAVDVELSVINAAVAVPVTQTKSQSPLVSDWEQVGELPFVNSSEYVTLFTAGDQLGVFAATPGGVGNVYLTDDLQTWTPSNPDPALGPAPVLQTVGQPSVVMSDADATYFIVYRNQLFDKKFELPVPYITRRDVDNGQWSEPVALPGFSEPIIAPLLASDGNGTLYFTSNFNQEIALYTSTDKGATWISVPNFGYQTLSSFDPQYLTMNWMDGKLWFVGPSLAENNLRAFSYTPDGGVDQGVVSLNGFLFATPNRQTCILNGVIHMLQTFSGQHGYDLQVFALPPNRQLASVGVSRGIAYTPVNGRDNFVGFTAYKGLLFASAGTALSNSGLWIYNLPID